ncbi:MAG: hypothetical protein ACYCV5_02025, partial [Acidimicrobiales bacterium]
LVEGVMATHVIGDPDAVVRGLADLVDRTAADELMVSTRAHSHDVRARSLTLVAQQWERCQESRQGQTGAGAGVGTGTERTGDTAVRVPTP